uniref:Peroxidase n=1 Tax=Oryza brachyantha TaxID=4533 RepID=J3MS05_ORYBR
MDKLATVVALYSALQLALACGAAAASAAAQGCDGSVLLDDNPFFVGEKTAGPNANSLRGFEVIDDIKAELEKACPETVSCADVLAIAARDSVVASGGPRWQVEVGRKDSRTASLQGANTNLPAPTSGVATLVQKFRNVGLSTKDMVALSGNHGCSGGPRWQVEVGRKDSRTASLQGANTNLPAPTSGVATLVQKFRNVGLSTKDMVALSGAHTIGKARCTTFSARLAGVGVSAGGGTPQGDMAFLQSLQQLCAVSAGSALAHLDLATPATFDNQYYVNLLSGEGLLPSDQALASAGPSAAARADEDVAGLVAAYAFDASLFFDDFASSMLRMGRLAPGGSRHHRRGPPQLPGGELAEIYIPHAFNLGVDLK